MTKTKFMQLLKGQRWRDYPEIVQVEGGKRTFFVLRLWRIDREIAIIHRINTGVPDSGARTDRMRRHYHSWLVDWYCSVYADAGHFQDVIRKACWIDGDRG